MIQLGTGYLHPLRDDDYISALLHRHTLPGGKAEFDMPRYKFWLEGDSKALKDDLDKWINVIKPICGGIEKLMWIIRESSEPHRHSGSKWSIQSSNWKNGSNLADQSFSR